MFYSHEILTSHQYGVATIWLAATVNTKTCMSRKAISEVDINKAVQKIIDPGAPLALRLQSNLLYGVSRVYNQKTVYILDDATRMSQKLRMTHSLTKEDHLVAPNVVKASRRNIMLEDNPGFLWDPISVPNFLSTEAVIRTSGSQFQSHNNNFRTSSHMSPKTPSSLGSHPHRGSAGSRGGSIKLDLGLSPDHSSINLPLNMISNSSPLAKHGALRISGDEDLMPLDDLGLDLDFGVEDRVNVVGDGPDFGFLNGMQEVQRQTDEQTNQEPTQLNNEQEDIVMMDVDAPVIPEEQPLPAAEAFPTTKKGKTNAGDAQNQTNKQVPLRRTRTPRLKNFYDDATEITNSQIRCDYLKYVDIQKKITESKMTRDAKRQAKDIALNCIFGNGLGHVNKIHPKTQHILAPHFSGPNWIVSLRDPRIPMTAITADPTPQVSVNDKPNFNDKDGGFIIPEAEAARRAQEDNVSLGDERSRRGTPAAEDHHSSLAPWMRGSSVLSSAKSARDPSGLASRLASPLQGRSQLQDIEHLSSETGNSMMYHEWGNVGVIRTDSGPVAREFREFREYVHKQAWQKRVGMSSSGLVHRSGGRKGGDGNKMVWMDFVEIAGPSVVTRAEAARAFLNILTMATKNECSIRSEYISADNPMVLGTHIIEVGLQPTPSSGARGSIHR